MVVISHSVLLNQLLDRSKTQTIRPIYSDYWLRLELGDELQHYWKVRKPRDKKPFHFLGESVVEKVFCLEFEEDFGVVRPYTPMPVPKFNAEDLAQRDGFDSLDEMVTWFDEYYGNELFRQEFVVIRYDWMDNVPPGSPRCPSCGERSWVTEVTGGEPWTCGTCGHEAGYEAEDPEVREELPRKIAESKKRSWKE